MIDKLNFFNSVSNGLLDIRVPSFVKSEAWEQVVDQAHKEWFIFVDKFAQVHVAKNSHHNTILTVLSAQDKRISIGAGLVIWKKSHVLDWKHLCALLHIRDYLEIT